MVIVLVVDQYADLNNGTTVTARRFAETLKRHGHEVRVVGVVGRMGEQHPKGAASPAPEEGVYPVPERYIPVVTPVSHLHGMRFGKPDREVLRRALTGADLVHILQPYKLGQVALKMAKAMGIPVTGAFHTQPENISANIGLGNVDFVNRFIYRHLYHTFFRFVDDIHCPSRFIAGELRRHGYHQRLHIISNGMDPGFTPGPDTRPEEWRDRFVILSIGRFSGEKRQDLLLRAARLSRYADRIQLVLAGRGPRERRLRRLARGLAHPVQFGFYPREELTRLARSCDLYVHAADFEIEGISCLEAFACGAVPVIGTSPKSATHQFALEDACKFEAGDPQSLADRIDYWVENPLKRQLLSARYARIAEEMRVEHSVRQIEVVFDQAVERNRRALARRQAGLSITRTAPEPYQSPVGRWLSRLGVTLALPLLLAIDKLALGLKFVGLKNLRGIYGGFVTVCNHVHPLDSTMVGLSLFPRQVFFPTLAANTRLKLAGPLVRALGGCPIPDSIGGLTRFFAGLERTLERGGCVHFFPEGELVPYSENLRPFQSGAFHLALRRRVPVVPMVLTYRETRGIARLWRRRPSMTLVVDKPMYSIDNEPTAEAQDRLKEAVYQEMERLSATGGRVRQNFTLVVGNDYWDRISS